MTVSNYCPRKGKERYGNSIAPKVREPREHCCSVLGKWAPAWRKMPPFRGMALSGVSSPALPTLFPLLITRPLRSTSAVISARIPPDTFQVWVQTPLCVLSPLCYNSFVSLLEETHLSCRVRLCCIHRYRPTNRSWA